MGAALPNGSIIPVTNLLGMKHYAVQFSHSQQCQSGLILNYYTKETGEVVNVLTPDGQDCFFAGKLAFVESVIQQTVKVARYLTWFLSGRVRYCLRATMGLTETDNKEGQSVKIVERAFDENKNVLHSAQLGEYNSAVSISSLTFVTSRIVFRLPQVHSRRLGRKNNVGQCRLERRALQLSLSFVMSWLSISSTTEVNYSTVKLSA
ncbi:unnamed protein product [Adineta ricciae]|uniref:Uncharacterized protein n=1 Tax=Adineta ricciae TaxID=249248 RepID=A0A815X4A3_ADIRI|nr:unnamed protein product [Adineta ricciae]